MDTENLTTENGKLPIHGVMPSYFKCRHFNQRQFLVEFICKAENEEEARKQWKKKYGNKYNLIEAVPL